MRMIWRTLFLALVCLTLTGCGSNLKPRGKVIKGGQPFTLNEGESFRIIFLPVQSAKEPTPYPANFDGKTGTFQVVGADLTGCPPGKYRATVEYIDKKRHDLLARAFNAAPLDVYTFDVNSSSGELVIDLDKLGS